MAKVPSDVVVFAFVAGSLITGCLGSVLNGSDPAGLSLGVSLVAALLWVARGLPGAVFGGSYRCPPRESRGRFVSQATLRKQHEDRKSLARTVVQQPSPYSSP